MNKKNGGISAIVASIIVVLAGIFFALGHIISFVILSSVAVFCYVIAIIYLYYKPRKPETAGCLDVVELKFRKK